MKPNTLATPVPVKTLATDGRLGTAAACVGGITRIQTVVAVIRRKSNNGLNLTNVYTSCIIYTVIFAVHVCTSRRTLVGMHLFYFSKEAINMGRIAISGTPRSERTVIFITAKTKEDLSKVAMVQRTSVNQVINVAIEKHLGEHQGDIKRYNDFFGEGDV